MERENKGEDNKWDGKKMKEKKKGTHCRMAVVIIQTLSVIILAQALSLLPPPVFL